MSRVNVTIKIASIALTTKPTVTIDVDCETAYRESTIKAATEATVAVIEALNAGRKESSTCA